ncbi:MAG: SRPBCC family protein, partial [Myxococcota bacterium]
SAASGPLGSLYWSLVVRPLHDALIEDAFDNAERALTGDVARPARWSLRVRLLRRVLDRLPA